MSVYVVGHKNPDTDAVVSAIVFSNLEAEKKEYIPAVAGKINKETEYVLNRFGFEVPKALPKEAGNVILVDTNGNPDELPEGVTPEKVVGVFDHHKMGGLKTPNPILIKIWPVGSTATLAHQILKEKKTEIPQNLAGAMIAAIVSDTLNFTSPTTTEEDKKAVEELNKIAQINVQDLADEMFAAKSDISGIPVDELIGKDYKVFQMGTKKVGIGVWETVKPELIQAKKSEILGKMKAKKASDGLDLIFFFSVDILNSLSELYLVSEEEKEVAESAYEKKSENNPLTLPGIVSRKKQMTPIIEKYILSRTAS